MITLLQEAAKKLRILFLNLVTFVRMTLSPVDNVQYIRVLFLYRQLMMLSNFFIGESKVAESTLTLKRYSFRAYISYEDWKDINRILEEEYPMHAMVDWFLEKEGLSQRDFDTEVSTNPYLREWMDSVWHEHFPSVHEGK